MKHGDFLWHDVMTSDTDEAGAFYAAVIGWDLQPAPGRQGDYTLLTLKSGEAVGGIMPIPEAMRGHAQPCWMTYVAVDDVDAAAKTLEALGGTVHRGPWEVPGVIRLAMVSDPQGAGFMIGRGLRPEAMPEMAPRTPGTVGWHQLAAADWAAAWPFYEGMFGWTKGPAFEMGPAGAYQLFGNGGEPTGGMMTKPAEAPMPFWSVFFNVEAVGVAADRVKALGGQVVLESHQVPGGDWIVHCQDPQGAYFSMTSPNP